MQRRTKAKSRTTTVTQPALGRANAEDWPDLKPRPLWLVGILWFVLAAVFWISNALVGGADRTLALPIQVRAAGLGELNQQWVWLEQLQINVQNDLQSLQSLDVNLGGQHFFFTKEEILARWTITETPDGGGGKSLKLVAPPEVSAPHSWIPGFGKLINWPGDWVVLSKSCPRNLILVLTVAVGAMVLVRFGPLRSAQRWIAQGLLGETAAPPAEPPPGWRRWGWLLAGAGVFLAALVIVEVQQPYFFSQDDNFAQYIPYAGHACRSLFSGVFPEWNPYQAFGSPAACTGFFLYCYLPTYLAYFIARYILANEYLFIEVFTIAHLAAGYAATYWMARKANLGPPVATMGSLCFVLSGYFLVAGRGWPAMLAVVLWTPLLIGLLLEMESRPVGWKWAVLTGLVMAGFFYVGMPQNWGYGMVMFLGGAALLVATRRIPLGRSLWILPAVLFAFGLMAPLLLSQVEWSKDMTVPEPYGGGVEPGMLATLLPYPIFEAPYPDPSLGNRLREYAGQLYYSGTLFCVTSFLAWGALISCRWTRDLVARNVWLFCGALALLFALGKTGLLWQLMSITPTVSKSSNHPFRALPMFTLCAVLAGGIILERLLVLARHRQAWEAVLVAGVGALLLWHALFCRGSFYLYGDMPYPPLPQAMADLLRPADSTELRRCISFSPRLSSQKGYCLSQVLGFPSVYRIISTEAYDHPVESKPQVMAARQRLYQDPLNAARAYGIRWVLVHGSVTRPLSGLCPAEHMVLNSPAAQALYGASRPVLNLPSEDLEIRELDGASPLAFAESQPGRALPVELNGAGATVNLSGVSAGGAIVVNFLDWPYMTAYADGKPVEKTADAWGRVRALVPPGAAKLEVKFQTPWWKGIVLGMLVAAVGIGTVVGLSPSVRAE